MHNTERNVSLFSFSRRILSFAQNEKGFHSLRLRSLSLVSAECKIAGGWWREEGRFRQTRGTRPAIRNRSLEEIIVSRATWTRISLPYIPLYVTRAKGVGILSLEFSSWKGSRPSLEGLCSLSCVRVYVLPSFKNAPCIQKRVRRYVCRIDGILSRPGLCDFTLRLIGYRYTHTPSACSTNEIARIADLESGNWNWARIWKSHRYMYLSSY